jgi:GT2 family glycosyltransferase
MCSQPEKSRQQTEDAAVTGNEPIPHPVTAVAPLITVAICTRNRARFLQRAVESVVPQMTGDTELLIVDNASTDDTPEVAARLAAANPRVKIWREPQPGICAARNAALAKAEGEYVLFFDDDQTVEMGWLDAYIQFLRHPPSERVAAVGGGIIPKFEATPPSWVNPANFTMDMGNQPLRLDGVACPGCGNCAFHRAHTLAVGGFCTSLIRYEESDLTQHLRGAGLEVWWLPGAPIFHWFPAHRLTVHAMGRITFDDGRSVALLRLRRIHGKLSRMTYQLGRIAITPFHVLACLLAALFTLPRRHRQISVGYLLRAIRIAGIGWQMLVNWGKTDH